MRTKKFYTSKINWTSLLLILIALEPVIKNQDFNSMNTKDWIVFFIGVAIIILRTFYTEKRIYRRKRTTHYGGL